MGIQIGKSWDRFPNRYRSTGAYGNSALLTVVLTYLFLHGTDEIYDFFRILHGKFPVFVELYFVFFVFGTDRPASLPRVFAWIG